MKELLVKTKIPLICSKTSLAIASKHYKFMVPEIWYAEEKEKTFSYLPYKQVVRFGSTRTTELQTSEDDHPHWFTLFLARFSGILFTFIYFFSYGLFFYVTYTFITT